MAAPAYHGQAPGFDTEKAEDEKYGAGVATHDNGAIEAAPATNKLSRSLHNRHMQMIAIGGAIGAGLFIGSGKALSTGGPASLTLGFIIVGAMLLFTVQALGELAVLYPVNGAFFNFICRFIDPAWGFALAWDYAIGWLVILPFEITAAGLTINFWRQDLDIGIWIAVFFVILAAVQIFGVRGYGEVEFLLSIIKVIACTGFIIFGIIVNTGGVPSDTRGYIGAKYWYEPGAFRNGFKGFCSVFVTAAFAFGGTELTGLAAAEAANPRKSLPKATKQVFWRIFFFYILGTFILGLIVPADDPNLLGASTSNTKNSPFVRAIVLAGVPVLPSIFNAVITISVISVANSATFGSTRTLQALAEHGMAPKLLAYVDKKGRPIPTVVLQMAFALLAFINEAKVGEQLFSWLLALSGLSNFFIWGSVCIAHIRFRMAWKAQGHTEDELPYKAPLGIIGSIIGAVLNVLCLIGQFYIALWPIGDPPNAESFFNAYLAAPVILALYLGWKIYSATSKDTTINSRGWKLWLNIDEIDLHSGLRDVALDTDSIDDTKDLPMWKRVTNALF